MKDIAIFFIKFFMVEEFISDVQQDYVSIEKNKLAIIVKTHMAKMTHAIEVL